MFSMHKIFRTPFCSSPSSFYMTTLIQAGDQSPASPWGQQERFVASRSASLDTCTCFFLEILSDITMAPLCTFRSVVLCAYKAGLRRKSISTPRVKVLSRKVSKWFLGLSDPSQVLLSVLAYWSSEPLPITMLLTLATQSIPATLPVPTLLPTSVSSKRPIETLMKVRSSAARVVSGAYTSIPNFS